MGTTILYIILRFGVRPYYHFDWWTDLFLIPIALPLTLYLYELVGLRKRNQIVSGFDIILYLIIWIIVREGIGPLIYKQSTAGIADVIAYSVGAALYYWLIKEKSMAI